MNLFMSERRMTLKFRETFHDTIVEADCEANIKEKLE